MSNFPQKLREERKKKGVYPRRNVKIISDRTKCLCKMGKW